MLVEAAGMGRELPSSVQAPGRLRPVPTPPGTSVLAAGRVLAVGSGHGFRAGRRGRDGGRRQHARHRGARRRCPGGAGAARRGSRGGRRRDAAGHDRALLGEFDLPGDGRDRGRWLWKHAPFSGGGQLLRQQVAKAKAVNGSAPPGSAEEKEHVACHAGAHAVIRYDEIDIRRRRPRGVRRRRRRRLRRRRQVDVRRIAGLCRGRAACWHCSAARAGRCRRSTCSGSIPGARCS